MVFNMEHPAVRALSKDLVNSAHPSFLHRFLWLDDEEIGGLDKGWNYLEGWYAPQYENLRAVHYTRGGPWFEHMKNCSFSREWNRELVAFTHCRETLGFAAPMLPHDSTFHITESVAGR